jgi:PD-(D/E)XK endonuclease
VLERHGVAARQRERASLSWAASPPRRHDPSGIYREHVFVENPNHKGDVAEAALAFAATKLGLTVLRPWSGHARYDLVLDVGGRLFRVQCKWGRLARQATVVSVQLGTYWHGPRGSVRTTYRETEVDLFGVYCGDIGRAYLLPASLCAGKQVVQLRLTAPRNGQRAGIILAEDYAFPGAVAQLGERCDGIAEARGSNPLSSTVSAPTPPELAVGADQFRQKFGYWMELIEKGQEIVVTRRGRPRLRMAPADRPRPCVAPRGAAS